MRSIYILMFFLIFNFLKINGINRDSIKVYIIGSFNRGETFKIHTSQRSYYIEQKMGKACDFGAWYLYIPVDSFPRNGDLMPLIIEKKRGNKYYDVKLRIYYEADRKYLILWKDYRQSKKYPFIALWRNSIFSSAIINNEIWSDKYNLKFIPRSEKRNADYSYFFEHLYEYQ